MSSGVGPKHVQLFDVARTAHFERIIRSGQQTIVLYDQRRYDFDPDLAARVGARRTGVLSTFWYTSRNDIDVLEIAEPLVIRSAPRSVAAVLGVRIRGVIRRRRTSVVTYAIENKDPFQAAKYLPVRARVKQRLQMCLVPLAWRSIDRVAYGTSQSRDLYHAVFRSRRPRERLIPALPRAEALPAETMTRAPVAVFLGDFSERKGFPMLLSAWPAVVRQAPQARLVLIGKGEGVPDALTAARSDDTISVVVDPPRHEIFRALERAKVLVLPSQPRDRWREQVGLPIVEGLGRGCVIVTTSETGLAEWLGDHGHFVVAEPKETEALVEALVQALNSERSPSAVLLDLPATDGRAEAQDWLLGGDLQRVTT